MGRFAPSVIDGLVVTDGTLLPDEARRLTAQAGGGDYSDPIVIELNGYPSRAKVYGLFGGGILLLLLVFGSLCAYFGLRACRRSGRRSRQSRRPRRRRVHRDGPRPAPRDFP